MTTTRMLDRLSDNHATTLGSWIFWLALVVASMGVGKNAYAQEGSFCSDKQTIEANVVVLDNPTVFNRLGAQNPNWVMYALERDVVHWDDGNPNDSNNGKPCTEITGGCTAGMVQLRPDKRPRPLVVRSVAGACLTVNFQNLLDPVPNPNDAQLNTPNPAFPVFEGDPNVDCADPANANNRVCVLNNNDQVASRCAGFHASGTELVNDMDDDGSLVGQNNPGVPVDTNCALNGENRGGLVSPGRDITYNLYTPHEGAFVVNSYGATIGSEQSSGNLGMGLFGALNVQPAGARMYRSQVTEEELRLAMVDNDLDGVPDTTPGGHPIIDYEAKYPNEGVWKAEGKGGLPVLNMLTADGELVHTDINAIIVGPDADGTWTQACADTNADPNVYEAGPLCPYPLESVGKTNPQLPNRLDPFREFTSIYHDEVANSQVFPKWYKDPVLSYTLAGVKDAFMINYGSGGIGSEIIANRLHTGPMHDCTDCAYEEFFLASQTVGDPAGLVNFPANTGIENCDPKNILDPTCWRQFTIPGDGNNDGVIEEGEQLAVGANPPIPGNYALFQEDPSNVHHGYTGDFTKIRNTHAGAFEQHIFHLHNHQWLFNPNDDNANYLDAQEIMPGSGHTYELVNGGIGNRNKTAGDAIFHCHFYPHFAQGMWYHIRIQDVFETGTKLAVSAGAAEAIEVGIDAEGNPILAGDLTGNDGFHDTPWALRIGKPAQGSRALPDGELADGWPIPAIVPLPGKAMPPMPAKVEVMAVDRGDFGVLSGRRPAGGALNQGPDSAQAVVKIECDGTPADCADAVVGPDGTLGTDDDLSPGYPFWLAGNSCGEPTADDPCPEGTVGQRMMTPVLDMLTEAGATALKNSDPVLFANVTPAQAGGRDGGLPRHNLRGYTSGGLSLDTQNRLDFRKIVKAAQPVYYPETGTVLERVSMRHHATREHTSYAINLDGSVTGGNFILNGSKPVPGGPFQDPCIDDTGAYLNGIAGEWFDGDGDPTTYYPGDGSMFHGGNPRTYKLANVQIDAVFNKVGHHYSQERIIALWEDVEPTINKQRPPEPLVMRFNTFDCGKLLHANLVPAEFEVDDFQVRTPTDIIGQHIHLPKWDLTTNDGAANGWNYEDGTLSPLMVQERIEAINNYNALAGSALPLTQILVDILGLKVGADATDTTADLHPDLAAAVAGHIVNLTDLDPVPTIDTGDPGSSVVAGQYELHAAEHDFFGPGAMVNGHSEYLGARTTIQRILIDPVLNVRDEDRGLGLTFSHDHYGPSTFQQIGLYSTILAEPANSTWQHNESGEVLGTRHDGGPTTWQAVITPPDSSNAEAHREFYFEMSDFQHAYNAGTFVGADEFGRPLPYEAGTKIKQIHHVIQPDPFNATVAFAPSIDDKWQETINPSLELEAALPDIVTAKGACPGPLGNFDPSVPRPCAEAINIAHGSTWVSNYRNEPVGLRVFDPDAPGLDGQDGAQAAGKAGDLAFALQSRTDRAIQQFNTSFGDSPYPSGNAWAGNYCSDPEFGDGINCDRQPGDPFTPIMRAFDGDNVKIKIQVGATEEQHQATVHGIKWLSNGSGFGRSPNSGWRNFQSTGISEQFSLQVPVTRDPGARGNHTDYLYANDATRPGFWLGTWGVLRAYRQPVNDLVELPNNPMVVANIANKEDFVGVCPKDHEQSKGRKQVPQNLKPFNVTVVLANQVLHNHLGAAIPTSTPVYDAGPDTYMGTADDVYIGGDEDGDGIADSAGGSLDPNGGTLVYNSRTTNVPDVTITEGGVTEKFVGGDGPLHDPTAILYFHDEDLIFDPDTDQPIGIKPGVQVEPLVIRANAGDCIELRLNNALPDVAPDLAGWQDMMWGVTRRIQNPGAGVNAEMYFFNNNMVRPSSYVGIHPQLVEFDSTKDDGVLVGQNDPDTIVMPGEQHVYRWYAGHLEQTKDGVPYEVGNGRNKRLVQDIILTATPVEFGATNLLAADRIKQPQKGLFGALSILPAGSSVDDTTMQPDGQGGPGMVSTRMQATVTAPEGAAGSGGEFREALAVGHKIANIRWADGRAIRNIHQGELGREGAEDSGHAGFNYGMEPSWFRFQLPPDVPFGNAGAGPKTFGGLPNAAAMYSNDLVGGDPKTPVFLTTAGMPTRMHVLNGASADRDGTFILHGHVWQRDPYVCPDDARHGLEGLCEMYSIGSMALGTNPIGKYMGGEEGMGHVYGYWPILFNAGGSAGVTGDYLFRDYSPSGNRNGQFGILRVEPKPAE